MQLPRHVLEGSKVCAPEVQLRGPEIPQSGHSARAAGRVAKRYEAHKADPWASRAQRELRTSRQRVHSCGHRELARACALRLKRRPLGQRQHGTGRRSTDATTLHCGWVLEAGCPVCAFAASLQAAHRHSSHEALETATLIERAPEFGRVQPVCALGHPRSARLDSFEVPRHLCYRQPAPVPGVVLEIPHRHHIAARLLANHDWQRRLPVEAPRPCTSGVAAATTSPHQRRRGIL
mmetsp:Transcript_33048/g.69033  ORF Transcript_33048/g.69033 Transcript_33048/m.69033 type:complete len:235 (-) Transcript_33048:66-770(-)